MKYLVNSILVIAIIVLSACNRNDEPKDLCGSYPDWETSPYVLPFPVGNTFEFLKPTVRALVIKVH